MPRLSPSRWGCADRARNETCITQTRLVLVCDIHHIDVSLVTPPGSTYRPDLRTMRRPVRNQEEYA
jgi:hypothetical protein